MTAMVPVHADGGACHGTPLVDGRCPGCGIELWPAPERKPAAGWMRISGPESWVFRPVGHEFRLAVIWWGGTWRGTIAGRGVDFDDIARGDDTAAQLAAEDALRAIAAEILRAVGRG